jgi:hypothetical protein
MVVASCCRDIVLLDPSCFSSISWSWISSAEPRSVSRCFLLRGDNDVRMMEKTQKWLKHAQLKDQEPPKAEYT